MLKFWEELTGSKIEDLPALGREVYPTFTAVVASCLWLEDQSTMMFKKICVDGELCKKLNEFSSKDMHTIISHIADILLTMSGRLPVFILATLLVKCGLKKLCGCKDNTPHLKGNVFQYITNRYMKDAMGPQPSTRYESFLWLGHYYSKQGNKKLAIKRLEDAELFVREKEEISYKLGFVSDSLSKVLHELEEKQSPKQKEERRRIILGRVLNDIGWEYINLEKIEEAIKLLKEANELNPNDILILDSLGWAHFINRNVDEAENLLSLAVKLDKDFTFGDGSFEIRYHYLKVLFDKRESDKSLTVYNQMLKKDPNSIWTKKSRKEVLGL